MKGGKGRTGEKEKQRQDLVAGKRIGARDHLSSSGTPK
jgi:hypothetical protein